jgi:type IV pilus assembly protein PilB
LDLPEQNLIDMGALPENLADYQVHHGVGCRTCNSTGHKGRLGVYELMTMGDELGEFVLNGASTLELKREAVRQGMSTLRMSALKKLSEGVTSVKEVVRATAAD